MSRLVEAVFRNDPVKITELLDRNPARVNDAEALCQGIGWGRKDVVRLFIKRGANLNTKDRNGNHPLTMACHSLAPELFDELVRHGSDPTQAKNITLDAAAFGTADMLRYLNHASFNLNQPGSRGVRPIEAAIGMHNLANIEYLLSINVDLTTIDVSMPLKSWKGAFPNIEAMEEIRKRIIALKLNKRGE